jgi:hypothetical protein
MIMPIPDDEQFEVYLKKFRPAAAEPLPKVRHRRAARCWFLFAGWALASAVVLVMTMIAMHRHPTVAPPTTAVQPLTSGDQVKNLPSLTLGRANEILGHAPSWRSLFDGLAFQSQAIPISKGSQSALEVLSKENIKL